MRWLRRAGGNWLILPIGAAFGWWVVVLRQHEEDTSGLLAALVVLGAMVLVMVAVRPVVGAVAIVGLGYINTSLLPSLIEIGELTVRYSDIVFLFLTLVLWMRIAIVGRISVSRDFKELFLPLFPFLLYIGGSLITVNITSPQSLGASLASYLRLLVTVAFGLACHLALRSERDCDLFSRIVIALAGVSVAVGAWDAWHSEQGIWVTSPGDRYGGLLGTNSLGLVSGLLVLYAVVKKTWGNPRIQWMGPLGIGGLGLVLSKSASSIIAACVAVAIYITTNQPRKGATSRFMKGLGILVGMITAGVLAIEVLRGSDYSGLLAVSGGSFAQRLMIAYGGLRIFADYPFFGTGWQASRAEGIISSPALNAALMDRFPGLPRHYFFLDTPTSLHNMYIQLLAELGIAGVGLFAYGLFRTGRTVLRIIRHLPSESPHKLWAHFYGFGLLLLLLWWNTNPLFGGQTESILAVAFLTALGTVSGLERGKIKRGMGSPPNDGSNGING